MNDKNTVTINDIARELGISNSTVSRALRNNPRISDEVTKRVKQTAAKMGYIPNSAAQSLRTGKSNTIGLLVRDINDGWSSSVIPFVENSCSKNGYGLILCNASNNADRERYYIRVLQQRRVDGILILTPMISSCEPYLPFSKNIPIVLMDIFQKNVVISGITVDHYDGAKLSVNHLLELNHRRIALLVGPMNLSPITQIASGYKKAMVNAGIDIVDQVVISTAHTGITDGFQGMLEVLKANPKPTSLITSSDLMAIGALDACKKFGISVPEDFSVVGYDDIPLSALMSPPLTTVFQDKEKLSKEAVHLLLERISNGEKDPIQIKIKPRLVIRNSTMKHDV